MPRLVPALLLILALLPAMAVARDPVPTQGYRVVKRYPHDTTAFTEGLFYLRGHLYESTGETGRSSVRKVDLETGRILQRAEVPPPYFGEGIVAWRDRLIQLTWRNHEGFVYDLATLTPRARFRYPGEGWALTSDDSHLYMSDGTAVIRELDPDTLQQVGSIKVTAGGRPLDNLNELEWVNGELLANVWLTSRIARIDPASGKVVAWIDLQALVPDADALTDSTNDVLNGIAFDAEHDRLFVTGKRWPMLYEIRLTPLPHAAAGKHAQ